MVGRSGPSRIRRELWPHHDDDVIDDGGGYVETLTITSPGQPPIPIEDCSGGGGVVVSSPGPCL
jgi:hypothetical protein